MNRCKTCIKWTAYTAEDLNAVRGAGRCAAALEMWKVTSEPRNDGEEGEENYRVLLPEHAKALCLVADATGHQAELVTMPDFGCVLHEKAIAPVA